jgi:hypothetical protein
VRRSRERPRSLKGGGPDAITAGSTAAFSALPTVLFNPIALQFGTRLLHATTAVHTIHIVNLDPGVLTITNITISGSAAANFSVRNTCIGVAIAVDEGCVIGIRFTPETHGIDNANLIVTDNGVQSPHTVPLRGRS